MMTYLICLNNEQCAAKAVKNQKNTSIITASTKEIKMFKHITFELFNPQPAIHSFTPSDEINRRSVTDSQHQVDEKADNCFIYH